MRLIEPLAPTWQARLSLDFARRNDATVLARREHFGPLRVQKALYPEGREVCHVIALHPPAGIAGGDDLEIALNAGSGCHALLTTPGATKWYRSAGAWATQRLRVDIAENAVLEWLPQPGILFDGALGRMDNEVRIAPGGLFVGWETLCFGRQACGERFQRGALQLSTRIAAAEGPLWLERGRIEGGSALLDSPVGLAGRHVSATLLAAGREIAPGLISACRAVEATETEAHYGITSVPRMLIARYLGDSAECAQNWLIELWRIVRPSLTGRDAQPPRIWST